MVADTYQVIVHCLRNSEHSHITENNVFYLVSLLPPSAQKSPIMQLLENITQPITLGPRSKRVEFEIVKFFK